MQYLLHLQQINRRKPTNIYILVLFTSTNCKKKEGGESIGVFSALSKKEGGKIWSSISSRKLKSLKSKGAAKDAEDAL